MGNLALLALRIVLALVLVGSLFVQAVMVPLLATTWTSSTRTTPTCAPRSSPSWSWAS